MQGHWQPVRSSRTRERGEEREEEPGHEHSDRRDSDLDSVAVSYSSVVGNLPTGSAGRVVLGECRVEALRRCAALEMEWEWDARDVHVAGIV